tara:strand:+ start:97 stop:369 length:273 start_codon:yes stop_codon:yes gene_type:complete
MIRAVLRKHFLIISRDLPQSVIDKSDLFFIMLTGCYAVSMISIQVIIFTFRHIKLANKIKQVGAILTCIIAYLPDTRIIAADFDDPLTKI